MAEPVQVDPVKRFVAILWKDAESLEQASQRLIDAWGAVDVVGADHPFDLTDYYQDEMGSNLRRRIIAFETLTPPESLVADKLACNRIEAAVSQSGRRQVNLDAGYLDHNKIVLASVKYAGQKIHLGQGIYADLVARYRDGRYQPFEWTFPDFRDGRYDEELSSIRRRYLEQLRVERNKSR